MVLHTVKYEKLLYSPLKCQTELRRCAQTFVTLVMSSFCLNHRTELDQVTFSVCWHLYQTTFLDGIYPSKHCGSLPAPTEDREGMERTLLEASLEQTSSSSCKTVRVSVPSTVMNADIVLLIQGKTNQVYRKYIYVYILRIM